MQEELKKIKDKYGEKMMHLCRELFPTILETEGLLYSILTSKFAPSKFLCDDIVKNHMEDEFKAFIYSYIDLEKTKLETDKTPTELLKEAGYTLYECRCEEDIQSFKKYYKSGEELCTFRGGRLNRCYVFFAVKDNVDEIKREDFEKPERQDKYGTSVISIQFTKGDCNTLSIKNRYNHTVINPDATFNNNLDIIKPGLTESFANYYGFNINYSELEFDLENYVLAVNEKFYGYNYEIDNVYYCPGNLIIDNFNLNTKYMNERYIVIDYFILDLKEKKIFQYGNINESSDSYDPFINEFEKFDKAEIIKLENGNRKITIKNKGREDIIIVINKRNRIIEYINDNMIDCGENFMSWSEHIEKFEAKRLRKLPSGFLNAAEKLKEINIPNVEEIGEKVLENNVQLEKLRLPKLKKIDNNFLIHNEKLVEISLPNVEKIGDDFLCHNYDLKKISLPNVKKIGEGFLCHNYGVEEIILPNVEKIGDDFLCYNRKMTKLSLPNLKEVGHAFLCNVSLTKISLPSLEKVGNSFISHSQTLKRISLPNLKKIGNYFLEYNDVLTELSLPSVKEIGDNFISFSSHISKLDLPNVKKIGTAFLYNNVRLKELTLPNVEEIGSSFLGNNKYLEKIILPNVKRIDNRFLKVNERLKQIELPSVIEIGEHFMYYNNSLEEIVLPNVEIIGYGFLFHNKCLKKIDVPTAGKSRRLKKVLSDIQSKIIEMQEEKNKIKVKKY